MAAISFRVENQKALRLAECVDIPRLMIICGSNGSGKSTLLWALMQRSGLNLEPTDTQVLYQGPHRAIRSQRVQRRWIGGASTSYAEGLLLQNVTVPEGIQIQNPSRSPDNVDESGSTIKHSLAKLENRRQAYIASIFDEAVKKQANSIDISQEKDIFAPLAEIVSRLLPHLEFVGIDFSEEDNIRVAFQRKADRQEPVKLDLNDLSSGEKAVILLFLPLVESEIRNNLDHFASQQVNETNQVPDRLFLLDEPELHLHPDLQRRMLAYMRERSSRDNVQFILITHSPTILDEANDEELYVLAPAFCDDNQLRQAATPAERLDALRELTGESYFLSTGRNIVCCEGESGFVKGKASDRSLIELFSKRSSRYTFIPMGGKSQVIAAVTRLRESLPVESYGVAVVGLIDSDLATDLPLGCTSWPFCEIENALLQPRIISDVVNRLFPDLGATPDSITSIIHSAGRGNRDDEVRLRIARELGTKTFRSRGIDSGSVQASISEFIAECQALFNSGTIDEVCSRIATNVDQQLEDGSYIRRFRGKKLLRSVFNSLSLPNIGFERFCYLLAGQVREDGAVANELDSVFSRLDAQVDEQLAALLVSVDVPLNEGAGSETPS